MVSRAWWRDTGVPVVRALVKGLKEERVTGLAAEIAFFFVLALFPALLALVGTLGFLDSVLGSELAEQSEAAILSFLGRVLTTRASEALGDVRNVFDETRGGLVSFATAGAIWALARGIMGGSRALRVANNVPRPTSWIRPRLTALALAGATILNFVALLAVVVVGPLLGVGQVIAAALDVDPSIVSAWMWLRYPLALALLLVWTLTLLHFGPGYRHPWRRDLPGAALATALWLAASLGLRLYLEVAGDVNRVFGVLGGGLILLIWLYLLGIALLTGGKLNAVLSGRGTDGPRRLPETPSPHEVGRPWGQGA